MGEFTDSNPGRLAGKAIPLLSGDIPAIQQYQRKREEFVSQRYPIANATKELFDLIFKLSG